LKFAKDLIVPTSNSQLILIDIFHKYTKKINVLKTLPLKDGAQINCGGLSEKKITKESLYIGFKSRTLSWLKLEKPFDKFLLNFC
jgi:hypothetical protein